MIENECKTSIGCLAFIFYYIFNDKMEVRLFYFHVTCDIAIKLISANPMLYKLRNLVTASNFKSFYSALFEPKLICYIIFYNLLHYFIILLIILIKKILWIKILTQLIICLFYTKENTQTAFAHTDSTNTPKKLISTISSKNMLKTN